MLYNAIYICYIYYIILYYIVLYYIILYFIILYYIYTYIYIYTVSYTISYSIIRHSVAMIFQVARPAAAEGINVDEMGCSNGRGTAQWFKAFTHVLGRSQPF